MKTLLLSFGVAFGLALLMAPPLQAQKAAPGSVTELKTSLSPAKAEAIAGEALGLGRRENMLPLTVMVLNADGQVVLAKSEDGSGLLRFDIALGKAWGALGMGLSSRSIGELLNSRATFLNGLAAASGGRLLPAPGGVLIVDANGKAIGAVGISGDTSARDEYCAIAGIKKSGLGAGPAEADPNWREK